MLRKRWFRLTRSRRTKQSEGFHLPFTADGMPFGLCRLMIRMLAAIFPVILLSVIPINAEEDVFKRHPNNAFTLNEVLEYRVHYGFINAGIARMQIMPEPKEFAGRKAYHAVGIGYTTGLLDLFFKVRDRYESYIDMESLLPLHFIRRVNEGGYIINQDVTFDHHKRTATSQKATIEVPENIHDLISAYYFARNMNFDTARIGTVYPLYAYLDDEVFDLKLKYLGKERINVTAGTFNCLKFTPVVLQGRVFKEEDDMILWISDDRNRIVIRAEAEILVGSVKMDLKHYSGLANPLTSKVK